MTPVSHLHKQSDKSAVAGHAVAPVSSPANFGDEDIAATERRVADLGYSV